MTWQVAARIADLDEGEVHGVTIGEMPVALYRLDGEVFATHNVCTHAQACMSDGYLEDGRIECPLHQALFDVRTGKVLSGPTDKNLPVYPVRLDGDDVLVDVAGAESPQAA